MFTWWKLPLEEFFQVYAHPVPEKHTLEHYSAMFCVHGVQIIMVSQCGEYIQ